MSATVILARVSRSASDGPACPAPMIIASKRRVIAALQAYCRLIRFLFPETRARRTYRNLIYFNEADKDGHSAAGEQPELFVAELRAAFSSLRPAH